MVPSLFKNVTLGQYFPGDTVLHRLDPRAKLIFVFIFIVALFTALNWYSFALIFVLTVSCILLSKIKMKTLLSGMKPILIIILLTAFLNLFYTPGEPLFDFWIFHISKEGLKKSILMSGRIILLISGTLLLTYTTSPIALTDGLEYLLNPLKKIKVPIHEMSMMMSMALRFIPTLIEEMDKIISAQKARGADFDTGGLIKKAKALLPILVPLFVSAFRRADELAIAMESRCYHGGEGRTRMKQLKMKIADYIALALAFAVLMGAVVLSSFGL